MRVLLVALIIFAANKYYAEMKKHTFYNYRDQREI